MKLQSFQPLPSWSINLLKEKQNGKRGSSPRVYKLQNSAIMISCFMIVSFFLNFVACTRIALEQICFQQGKLTVDCGQMNYRSILLVCPWRHGGHVGGLEQKHFSPLGSKLYFHVNSSRKYSFVLTRNMAALSRGCKPRIPQATLDGLDISTVPRGLICLALLRTPPD